MFRLASALAFSLTDETNQTAAAAVMMISPIIGQAHSRPAEQSCHRRLCAIRIPDVRDVRDVLCGRRIEFEMGVCGAVTSGRMT